MPLNLLLYELSQEFPSFRILPKDTSWAMRILFFLLRIVTLNGCPDFMTRFVTTIGTRVYVPSNWANWDEDDKVCLLRHERVHMRQARKYTFIGFAFLYLLLWFPLGLAYFRCKFEQEAYAETMRADAEAYGVQILLREDYKRNIMHYFLSGAYGWMWPFEGQIEDWYEQTKQEIRAEMLKAKK